MASTAHCLYCFEAIISRLEKRPPLFSLTLSKFQSSWAEYAKTFDIVDEDEAEPEAPKNPIVQRLQVRTPSGSSTPSSSSSSELDADTAATTPASSTQSFNTEITESPLFITWNTISSRRGRSLRGCIGTFESQPLGEGLKDYAEISAFNDDRFDPISLSELHSLEVAVTLLTDFEEAANAMDWEVGTHGIRISFKAKGRRYGACYLPDVAVEQGWTKEATILSLMRKAGWGGDEKKWQEVNDLKVVRFKGKAKYAEYKVFADWREWVTNEGKK